MVAANRCIYCSDCSWWLQLMVAAVQLLVGRQGFLLQVTSEEGYCFFE